MRFTSFDTNDILQRRETTLLTHTPSSPIGKTDNNSNATTEARNRWQYLWCTHARGYIHGCACHSEVSELGAHLEAMVGTALLVWPAPCPAPNGLGQQDPHVVLAPLQEAFAFGPHGAGENSRAGLRWQIWLGEDKGQELRKGHWAGGGTTPP